MISPPPIHNTLSCAFTPLWPFLFFFIYLFFFAFHFSGKKFVPPPPTFRCRATPLANYKQRSRTTERSFVKSTPIFVMHTHKYGMRTLLVRYAYAMRTLWTLCEDVCSTQLNSYVGKVVRTVSFAIRYPYAELIRCSLTAPYVWVHSIPGDTEEWNFDMNKVTCLSFKTDIIIILFINQNK